ncbi:unnamed protein product, partial [Pelagomonas calceolata]
RERLLLRPLLGSRLRGGLLDRLHGIRRKFESKRDERVGVRPRLGLCRLLALLARLLVRRLARRPRRLAHAHDDVRLPVAEDVLRVPLRVAPQIQSRAALLLEIDGVQTLEEAHAIYQSVLLGRPHLFKFLEPRDLRRRGLRRGRRLGALRDGRLVLGVDLALQTAIDSIKGGPRPGEVVRDLAHEGRHARVGLPRVGLRVLHSAPSYIVEQRRAVAVGVKDRRRHGGLAVLHVDEHHAGFMLRGSLFAMQRQPLAASR